MTDQHIMDDVMKAVNKRVAAGDFTIDPTTKKGVAELMARWLNKSATPGDVRYRTPENVMVDVDRDELLSRRLSDLKEGMLERLVAELIDEEFELPVSNGDLEKSVGEDGVIIYFEPQ
jgi:hypothetical protein